MRIKYNEATDTVEMLEVISNRISYTDYFLAIRNEKPVIGYLDAQKEL